MITTPAKAVGERRGESRERSIGELKGGKGHTAGRALKPRRAERESRLPRCVCTLTWPLDVALRPVPASRIFDNGNRDRVHAREGDGLVVRDLVRSRERARNARDAAAHAVAQRDGRVANPRASVNRKVG